MNTTTSPRTATAWLVCFAHHDPVMRRYQMPVTAERVLAEHRAALSAEPIEPLDHQTPRAKP